MVLMVGMLVMVVVMYGVGVIDIVDGVVGIAVGCCVYDYIGVAADVVIVVIRCVVCVVASIIITFSSYMGVVTATGIFVTVYGDTATYVTVVVY